MFLQIIIIICFSLFFTFSAFPQSPFRAGIFGGITTTQIDGDGYSGFNKFGGSAGGFVNNNFSSGKWSIQMELLFIQKGSRRPPNVEKGVLLYQINLNYVEVPVLAKLRYKNMVYEAGLSWAKLIRHREFDMSGELLYIPPFKKNELAFNAGIDLFITENFSLNARFIRSILPVRDYVVLARFGFFGLIGGSYNTALSYTLRYQFGKGVKKGEKKEEGIDIKKLLKIE